ncbi:CBS domain-containing protein [Rhizobium sp. BK376]|uniref:CBS domain-containing protein n=1 Tax=Rhizobium sp. BK376 TaxID=2512149 RepID=UPI0010504C96|nr:CBS domain-containing protein [Rhizobium sp. BK376]TCR66690.1 CBS domain protein [Rhizobium sp. BK376]
MLAKDIMVSPVITIGDDQSIERAVELVNSAHVGAVPVVDKQGWLVGIVTEGDLIRRIASSGIGRQPVLDNDNRNDMLAHYIKARSWRIKDVMTSPVVTAPPTATIARLAELLLSYTIKHVPIMVDGQLLGMVSRRDLMRAMMNPPSELAISDDEALLTAVRSRLGSELGISPDTIQTSIKDGWVALHGEVSSLLEREAARVAAESVPGVRGVANDILVAHPRSSPMRRGG